MSKMRLYVWVMPYGALWCAMGESIGEARQHIQNRYPDYRSDVNIKQTLEEKPHMSHPFTKAFAVYSASESSLV